MHRIATQIASKIANEYRAEESLNILIALAVIIVLCVAISEWVMERVNGFKRLRYSVSCMYGKFQVKAHYVNRQIFFYRKADK